MKKFLLIFCLVSPLSYSMPPIDYSIDTKSPYDSAMDGWQRGGEMAQQVQNAKQQRELHQARMAQIQKESKLTNSSSLPDINTADVKSLSNKELFGNIVSYLSDIKNKKDNQVYADTYKNSFEELDARVESGNPSAPLYRGIINFPLCKSANDSGTNTVNADGCKNTFKYFGITARTPKTIFPHERAIAFSYLGEMYENGIGVEKSNLLAADAFYNAGVLYNKNNNKEKALSNLEKAIHLYPDHKKAKGLIEEILNN
ncbi:hypothetical protein IX88_14005 [Acinetobacter baumannii]|uniref:tetratricopeptide repeat protein n=2 Tax=Acinetobacter baumannii TaxID=470 RepID=UPI0004F80B31|nr:tetratricopeptide repeat protein [Acinetobacter baumannii]AIL76271.1 hypothetical protein IX88_14005 [Acinetobacter baumannii]KQE41345.1 hypothetical protein APD45_11950 [Acinetobacter baumannii]KQE48213.1 hypothetical protein APD45_05605 [Acinetobacter baumannii]MBC6816930.1 hypothetical protein [Acinetobacter baumannii]